MQADIEVFFRFMSSSAATFHPRGPTSNVYLYMFDYLVDADNCEEIYPIFGPVFCYYASHGTELPYLFNSGEKTGYVKLSYFANRMSRIKY